MTDDPNAKPEGEELGPALMSPKFGKPGRKWIPRSGEFAGRVGEEACATRDLTWVGLTFPGESDFIPFRTASLQLVQ